MTVIETALSLKRKLNKANINERQKLQMLLELIKNKDAGKRHLAAEVGIGGTTILTWKRKYQTGGLDHLLAERTLVPKVNQEIENMTINLMAYSPYPSFSKIHMAVQEKYIEIGYSTLIKHIKTHQKDFFKRYVESRAQERLM